MKKSNKTGVTGVNIKTNSDGHVYVSAQWNDLSGKRHSKSYSISKYGYDLAFSKAVEARKIAIEELNLMGAGYSKFHGLPKEINVFNDDVLWDLKDSDEVAKADAMQV